MSEVRILIARDLVEETRAINKSALHVQSPGSFPSSPRIVVGPSSSTFEERVDPKFPRPRNIQHTPKGL